MVNNFYINLGCIHDPIFGTPWCLDFKKETLIGILVIITIVIIWKYIKDNYT